MEGSCLIYMPSMDSLRSMVVNFEVALADKTLSSLQGVLVDEA
jgi:hypothetical protein